MLHSRRVRRVLYLLAGAVTTLTILKLCVDKPCTPGHGGTTRCQSVAVPVDFAEDLIPTSAQRHETVGGSAGSNQCKDSLCSQYLSKKDKRDYDTCSNSAARQSRTPLESSTCRFMNGSARKPVALASFPGSGNTWVRGLLQMATGVCTGSLYCDKSLRRGGFPGEGVRSGSVLVVKTHKWKSRNRRLRFYSNMTEHFSAAIFIVRSPFHALVSERHRKTSLQHTDVIGSNHFGERTSMYLY